MRIVRRPDPLILLSTGLLAALAYLPLLVARPGKLPADTKLGLTLDPARLMATALSSWDTDQFAGWVPHQSISYLWPSGPFYWLAQASGIPSWATQRLFLGTLLFAAGLGMFRFLHRRGYTCAAAFIGALTYQLSPYLLPYASRTSVMLLPWAAVPWLMHVAGRCARAHWVRPTAAFTLIVLTMASVNLTATLVIAPAPLLVLLDDVRQRSITARAALLAALRLGASCAAISLWWVVMLGLQGRYGADVLRYSETLEATSATSTALEVLRQSGYWLSYVVTPDGATTSAAVAMMSSRALVVASLLLLLTWFAALVLLRFRERWLASALLLCGLVIAVGVHPIDDPSPLMSPLAEASRSSFALALRSSTRAVPLVTAAAAISLAALVQFVVRRERRPVARAFVAVTALLVAVNLPSLFTGTIIDENLLRDELPGDWSAAARIVDAGDPETRVIQLPGVESQSFDWGYTVDPPLAWTIERPLLTRDWLPLGTVGMMDLWYAFDDRFQDDVGESATIAPIARLTGSGTIWLAGDADSDRFDSASAAEVRAVLDAAPDIEHDTDIGPVSLYDVERPRPISSASTRAVLLVGSGDGIIDAAAAGLIDGTEVIRYAALTGTVAPDPGSTGDALVILTDSNRKRARQWRGSQDVWGALETASEGAVSRADPQDARFPLFLGQTTDDQTIAIHQRLRSIVATSYGSPFRLLPEVRPAQAVDGDRATSWIVGREGGPVIGESITLDGRAGPLRIVRTALEADIGSRVTAVRVTRDGHSVEVVLDPSADSDAGQLVEPPTGTGPLTVTITAVDGAGPTGFAELLATPDPEVVRTPLVTTEQLGPGSELAIVLTRLRAHDEEPQLRRLVTLPRSWSGDWRVQVRALDGAVLPTGCVEDVVSVDGRAHGVLLDADGRAALESGQPAWAPLCTMPGLLPAGEHTITSIPNDHLQVDRLVASPGSSTVPSDPSAHGPSVSISRGGDTHELKIDQCSSGCWVVFGEGFSDGWSAASEDANVGPHTAVNGGANGWWIEPDRNGEATLLVRWAPERVLDLALVLSTLVAAVCLGVLIWPRSGERTDSRPRDLPHVEGLRVLDRAPTSRRHLLGVVAATGAVAVAVSPVWALVVVAVGATALAGRRPPLFELAALATVAVSAAGALVRVVRRPPPIDFGWPQRFELVHRPLMCAIVAATTWVLLSEARRPGTTASEPTDHV